MIWIPLVEVGVGNVDGSRSSSPGVGVGVDRIEVRCILQNAGAIVVGALPVLVSRTACGAEQT